MSVEELPSIKQLKGRMDALGVVLAINKFLHSIGMGSKKITDTEGTYDTIRQQLKEYTEYPAKFNRYFAADGWLAHDSLNFDVLKQAVEAFESRGKDEATEILLEYYGPSQVEKRLFFLNHVEELRIRRKFTDYALADHKAGRHYSAIPLLLMVVDGAVNDAVGKGFHAHDLDLDTWDSLVAADGAIYLIKQIFQKGRRKTSTSRIDLPYRNGILHGMDLEYDNPTVTAKAWCFLFVVRDWLLAKKSETERKNAFEEEARMPSLRELAEQLRLTNSLRRAVESWKPREITPGYIEGLNRTQSPDQKLPEATVLEFLALWKKRNYGHMAQLFWREVAGSPKKYARDVRERYGIVDLTAYSILRIVDEAPAIAEITAQITESSSGTRDLTFRLIREDGDGDPVPANLEGGTWRIVWMRNSKQESEKPNGSI